MAEKEKGMMKEETGEDIEEEVEEETVVEWLERVMPAPSPVVADEFGYGPDGRRARF